MSIPARRVSPLRRASLLALAGLALSLGGCESGGFKTGPQRTPDQRREAFPIDYEQYGKLGYRLDWVGYPSITGSLPITFFEPYDDLTVVLEQGSTVSILEPNTGARRCAIALANPITKFAGIARDERHLLISSDADVFLVDPATCNVVGRQRIEKIVNTEPARIGNILVFGTPVGEVLAHLTTSTAPGVKAWGFLTSGAIEANPVLMGTNVGVVSQAGDVVFLDATTGALIGRNRIFGGMATNPVADEQVMYIASLDQSVYAIAAKGGAPVWRYRTASPLRTQPTLHAGRLYVGIPGEGLVAFDAATGKPVWKAAGLDNTVIVGINRGRLVGFDKDAQQGVLLGLEQGDLIERVQMPGAMILKTDKFEDGRLYVASKSGVMARFLPR